MGWDAAVYLVAAYLIGGQKADQLLDQLPENFVGERRAACQSLSWVRFAMGTALE